MAAQSFFSAELRPDQQRYARMAGGMASPLWIPFMAAASMGAAWWMMQNWPRLATGVLKTDQGADAAGRSNGLGASASPAAPAPAAAAAAARAFTQEVAAPLTEALAVQGANDAEAGSSAQARTSAAPQPQPAPAAEAAPAWKPAVETAPPPRKAKAPRKAAGASDEDPAVSKLLAAAAQSEPELPPHEGLPARKKSSGKRKKNGG